MVGESRVADVFAEEIAASWVRFAVSCEHEARSCGGSVHGHAVRRVRTFHRRDAA